MEREEMMEMLGEFKKSILSELKQPEQQTSPQPQTAPQATGKHAELIGELMAAMDARNKSDAQKVYDTMFNEKVSALTAQYPAFGEYLNSEDDFGEVILDRIRKIEDYSKRVSAFDKVFKNFATAQSSGGQDMRLSRTVKKQVEDDTTQRDAIKDKFLKGEMSMDDFTMQYFGTVEAQMGRLEKGK